MPVNSRQKGKRGELEAVGFLKALGYADARRTQQYNGLGKGDVVCPLSLPQVHFEVKFGYPVAKFDICTKLFADACQQAVRDAGVLHWVLLWKPKGYRMWRATYETANGLTTVAGVTPIQNLLMHFSGN